MKKDTLSGNLPSTPVEQLLFSESGYHFHALNKGWRISKRILYWICQIGGWTTYGAYLTFLQSTNGNLSQQVLVDTVVTTLCLLVLSHFYRNYIVKNHWIKLLFGKLLLRIILTSFLLSLFFIPIALGITSLINQQYLQSQLTSSNLITSLLGGAFLFFSWSVCYFLYHYVSSYNRNLKWEALVNEFELNKLRSQLNPHFIFNALNTVNALIDEDPVKAKASVYQLSNILRNSLLMDKKKVIPFEEEFKIVRDYLALESTRFEERLKVEYHIQEESLQYKVPPLMIQTIVENGIKHGISKLKNGGFINITTKVDNDEVLVFEIRNSGQYKPIGKQEGYGLKSTIQRLKLLYNEKASFQIVNENQQVLTEIRIPKWNNADPVISST
ncbi:histidine kinase [Rapidithrix thailandica]|uniref:Histidine kinase n=1 Tax=Rapidithrix thailandica TaxID=413964 RepID=A0AAW9SBE2_9BACT